MESDFTKAMNAGCFGDYSKEDEYCDSCKFKVICMEITEREEKDNREKLIEMSEEDFTTALERINKTGCKGMVCSKCPIDNGSELCLFLAELLYKKLGE